jgi:hypothetical protein
MLKPDLPGPSRTKNAPNLSARGPDRAPSAFQGGHKTKRKSSEPGRSSRAAIIVFGLDQRGKPKAGRFAEQHAAVARKAALALKLAVCRVDRPTLVEIATRIPVGRLHAQGKAFLPYIGRDLYDQLAAAAIPGGSMAAAAKAAPSVAMEPTKGRSRVFIVIGFDDRLKPRGARYLNPDEDQLAKVVEDTDLRLYELRSPDLIELAGSLPVGKLPATGPRSTPEIKQIVYSEIVCGIAEEAGAVPRGKTDGPLPAQKGSPESWDVIDTGHLVVAQECPEYGWAEAIVVERKGSLLTLRYRDYPKLPKFHRQYRTVALLNRANS